MFYPRVSFIKTYEEKNLKNDDRKSFLFLREFGGEKCEIWIFNDGKSSSILFQRVWWLKIDCTLFPSPPNWIKTFKLNSLQTSPFLEKFLRSKGMKLFDRKVLWQIKSHLFLLGSREKNFNGNPMNPICLEIFCWLQNDSFGPERSVLCGHSWLEELIQKQNIFPGTLPLNVTFKLPVSEISEIDDHKSVRFTTSLHSFL